MAGDDATQLLQDLSAGDGEAVDRLLPLVYDELHRLAGQHLRRERRDHTLQPTALVHEAYLRLIDQTRVQWQNRAHFMAVASQAIRRILVDHARSKGRKKRGGDRQRIALDQAAIVGGTDDSMLVDLDEALVRLATEHPEKVRVVEMRFFGGLPVAEVAEVLGVTTRTVERYWQFARAWLYRELAEPSEESSSP
ncbi:MAG: sigma-70 family RNA polymerase sigma factor [Phycisphaerales bacterium]|nr:sigma-70 family RNA polymerase sigma factor [Phycisphaerales bacterium]